MNGDQSEDRIGSNSKDKAGWNYLSLKFSLEFNNQYDCTVNKWICYFISHTCIQ